VHHLPRTYAELEPPADYELEVVHRDRRSDPAAQFARYCHGVGEPMLVKNLPRMVRIQGSRQPYVLFNTNGTVLNERNGRALIEGRSRTNCVSRSTPPLPSRISRSAARIISIAS